MRRTREQIRIDNRPKAVEKYVLGNRYLRESKYHKNNYWSVAHWQSWAAQGKAGGCGICGEGYYNATLHNKRKNTDRGGKKSWLPTVSCNVCGECMRLIEQQLGVELRKSYAG